MTLNPADPAFADMLSAALPNDVVRGADARYLEEPRGRFFGRPGFVALPRDKAQVARIVTLAAQARVGIVPYGGGTGLVSGQVAPDGPIPLILSLERMNQITALYPDENVLVCEAGAILEDIQKAAEDVDRLFPLSLASEGSARIGGNLSTNAGGTGVLRYGNTRDLCLGLEAVLPDGQIWNGLSRLRKDNTGYDLRHLLIGAEGSLGVITAASLKLSPRPASVGTAIFVVRDVNAALALLSMARARVGEMVSAFELIHRQGYGFLAQVLPEVRQPFADPPEWSVLIEVGMAQGMNPQDVLEGLYTDACASGLVEGGVIAQNAQQAAEFWSVREHIPEANKLIGAVASTDVSVPLGAVSEFIAVATARIADIGAFRINCFGHLGDGNLHFNVFPNAGETRSDYAGVADQIIRTVHDLVNESGGSVSAEHGIGRMKVAELERYGDPAKLSALRAIKAALDPKGIMNPGVIVRN
ncbi:MAG: FAD-binding oxidoreductase [Sulfitobacter sp.]